jgi:hypothetical protein
MEQLILEDLIRFLAGGIAVSVFAVLGDIFRPKSFAGLFGAAPSIALSTLALALFHHGARYGAIEGRSMMIGAAALVLYSVAVCQLMQRYRWHALPATGIAILVWITTALAGKILTVGV